MAISRLAAKFAGSASRTPPPPGAMASLAASAVFVDLNGDGRPDGYLVIGHAPGGHGPAPGPAAAVEVDPAILATGASLFAPDI